MITLSHLTRVDICGPKTPHLDIRFILAALVQSYRQIRWLGGATRAQSVEQEAHAQKNVFVSSSPDDPQAYTSQQTHLHITYRTDSVKIQPSN